jgi:alpha-L-fucosidase 2
MKQNIILSILILAMASGVRGQKTTTEEEYVIWHSPSENSMGSMPAGNGDLGINLWAEKNGDLLFYLSKTDAWNENSRLFKLGRVRLSLSPNPFKEGNWFVQELKLNDGIIHIEGGSKKNPVSIDVWVDANHPVVEMKVKSATPVEGKVSLEIWRDMRRKVTSKNEVYSFPAAGAPDLFIEPDTIIQSDKGLVWAHRNSHSIWTDNLKLQSLGEWTKNHDDPLLNRTFGGMIVSKEMKKSDDLSLLTKQPSKEFSVSVFALTGQSKTLDKWKDSITHIAAKINQTGAETRLGNHKKWWNSFWDRSYIRISSTDSTQIKTINSINQGYCLQRYMNACSGRGNFPIKFNGSIFTVDTQNLPGNNHGFDADYRQWDGAYWCQNTRLPYWSMLAAGDFDLMLPLFKMYSENLPLRKLATKKYYGHDGAFFPETFYFWGAYMNENYGTNRDGKPDGLTDNLYIRRYWQGGLELSLMMLDYYGMTQNETFARETLIPFTAEILTFFDQHWKREANGKIRFEPAQSLETWRMAVNPLPEIAGLRSVLSKMAELPNQLLSKEQHDFLKRLNNDLPPIPVKEVNGKKVIAPAEICSERQNTENPELYAVFPYRIFGIGKPHLDVGINTFNERGDRGTGGWVQNAIQAACLGLTKEAAGFVGTNFSASNKNYRFPATWGPNYDWTPDQDHGSVAMIALQNMLLQATGDTIFLLPAWPEKWEVEFKLHTPGNSFIEGSYSEMKGLKIADKRVPKTIRIKNSLNGKEIK